MIQTSGPSAANYIDDDARVKPSEIQQDLKKHFARIYDTREAIEQLAQMLSPIDSPEALQGRNQLQKLEKIYQKLLVILQSELVSGGIVTKSGDRGKDLKKPTLGVKLRKLP